MVQGLLKEMDLLIKIQIYKRFLDFNLIFILTFPYHICH